MVDKPNMSVHDELDDGEDVVKQVSAVGVSVGAADEDEKDRVSKKSNRWM